MGTSVSNAQSVMESKGFRCESVTNGEFKVLRDGITEEKTYRHIDYLYCTTSRKRALGVTVWDIVFVHENGTVTNVLVRRREFGLGDL